MTRYTTTDEMTETEMRADYKQWHEKNYINLVLLAFQTQKKTGNEIINFGDWTMQQYVIYRRTQASQYA